jgi:hypothetical protein
MCSKSHRERTTGTGKEQGKNNRKQQEHYGYYRLLLTSLDVNAVAPISERIFNHHVFKVAQGKNNRNTTKQEHYYILSPSDFRSVFRRVSLSAIL